MSPRVALVLLLVVPTAAAAEADRPLGHVAWEGPPLGPAQTQWAPEEDCWSHRGDPAQHIFDAGPFLRINDGPREKTCIVHRQALPTLPAHAVLEVRFEAQRSGDGALPDLWVNVSTGNGRGTSQRVFEGGATQATGSFAFEGMRAPWIEWTFHDRSVNGTAAAAVEVDKISVYLSGGAPYAMSGHPLTQSWLGAQLVAEHLWRFRVPEGPPGWTPHVQVQVPDQFTLKTTEDSDVSTLHAGDGASFLSVPAAAGDEVIVRTLAPRFPDDDATLSLTLAVALAGVAVSATAIVRAAARLGSGGRVPVGAWTVVGCLLVLDALTVARIAGMWNLMVQAPLHPIGVLLFFALGLLVVANGVALVVFLRMHARRVGAALDRRTREAAQLRRINLALDRFAAGLAHDLKGPLGAARMSVELAADDPLELDPRRRVLLGEATQSLSALQLLVHEMLDYSSLSESDEPFSQVDLQEALDEACEVLGPLLRQHTVRVENGILPVVWARRRQVGRIFQNLLENAAKHAGVDEVHVRVTSLPDRDMHHIVLEDNGHGIAPGDEERIFDAFHRGASSGEGRGLGLPMVRRIIEDHGGAIHAESSPRGTAFRFSLPAVPRHDGPGSGPSASPASPHAAPRSSTEATTQDSTQAAAQGSTQASGPPVVHEQS